MKKLLIWAAILGAAAYGGSKWYLHHKVGRTVDMAVMMMSPVAQVEYGGVSSTMSGELTIDNLTVYINGFKDPLYIDRFGIDTPSFLSLLDLDDISTGFVSSRTDVPSYFGIIVAGLRMPVDADYFEQMYRLSLAAHNANDIDEAAAQCTGKYGFSPQALAAMGYREQEISASLIARQHDNNYALEIKASTEDMWKIDGVMTLAGDMKTELLKGSAYRPRLDELEVEYTDQSLNDRIIKYCARLGLSAEQINAARLAAFNYAGEHNGVVFDEYVLEPYQEFLAGKSTLLFKAHPTEPINVSHIDLYKPEDVPALLKLEAAAY